METTRRQERLSELYRKVISSFARDRLKLEGGILSITKVEVASGLEHLKVYFSVWPDEKAKDMLQSLKNLKGELRLLLGQKVKTKTVPTVEFILDEAEKKQHGIEALLKKI